VYTPGQRIIGWFDGATQQNGDQSGAGGVLKISEQTTYKWTLNCGHGTNTRAELMGVWALLTLASRLSISYSCPWRLQNSHRLAEEKRYITGCHLRLLEG
jgi:hypothetical protein